MVRHVGMELHGAPGAPASGAATTPWELEFLAPASFTLLTERRRHRPWGLEGGGPGAAGENRLNGEALPPKFTGHARPGDRLLLASPGGGGYGLTENEQKNREIGKPS